MTAQEELGLLETFVRVVEKIPPPPEFNIDRSLTTFEKTHSRTQRINACTECTESTTRSRVNSLVDKPDVLDHRDGDHASG